MRHQENLGRRHDSVQGSDSLGRFVSLLTAESFLPQQVDQSRDVQMRFVEAPRNIEDDETFEAKYVGMERIERQH